MRPWPPPRWLYLLPAESALRWASCSRLSWSLPGSWKARDGNSLSASALAFILSSLPVFYLDWRILTPYLDVQFLETGRHANVEVAVLSHLILFLSAIKLLQRKGDRDWFFLYLISFFEVLLAAGLSASPTFLLTLTLYLLCMLSTAVAFEIIRRGAR